jgi:hypothetical protein
MWVQITEILGRLSIWGVKNTGKQRTDKEIPPTPDYFAFQKHLDPW